MSDSIREISQELTEEILFHQLTKTQQQDMIEDYCSGIAERIKTAQSLSDAMHLADDECRNFEKECLSSVIRTAVRSHILKIIQQQWS